MKIIFAIKNMKNAKGGAEKVLSIVVNGLAKKGYDITLLTFDGRGLGTFYKIDDTVKKISLGIGDSADHSHVRETLARMRAMRKIVKVRKPDIVIPFMHSMFIPMAFALIGMKIKIIASEHIVPMHYRKKKFQYILLMLSYFFVQKITVLSHQVKKLYPRFMRKKMIVLPNPVYIHEDKINVSPPKRDRKIILNVGRLSEQKDQKTLIRAFALLADKYPDWDVRIVGEGENRKFLEDVIIENGLSQRVFLVGTTDNMAHEYLGADIFAMPSRYESFGLATAEAMSFGLPAIGFKTCAGTNEIIQDGHNGYLVSRQNKKRIEHFANGLESLMKDEKLRHQFGEQAKHHIESFKPDLIVNQWERLIQETNR